MVYGIERDFLPSQPFALRELPQLILGLVSEVMVNRLPAGSTGYKALV